MIAADILQTAMVPTWEEIGKLAAIAAIRTALNCFLERELKEIEKRDDVKDRTARTLSIERMLTDICPSANAHPVQALY